MTDDVDGRELLTTRQVAKLAGVTPQSVVRWVEQGKLTPTMKAPGTYGAYFYRPDVVEAFLTAASTEGANHTWNTPPAHASPQPRRRSSD